MEKYEALVGGVFVFMDNALIEKIDDENPNSLVDKIEVITGETEERPGLMIILKGKKLLEAASEAEPGTGRVEVQLAILPKGKIIRVSNNGTTIPPEQKDKLFRPGFTTKEPCKHSGLGLYSVK